MKKCIFGLPDSTYCVKHWSLMGLCFYGKSYLLPSWELWLTLPKFEYASLFPLNMLFHRTHYSQFIQILVGLPILLNTIQPMWHLIVIRYTSRPIFSPILLLLLRQIRFAVNTTSSTAMASISSSHNFTAAGQ